MKTSHETHSRVLREHFGVSPNPGQYVIVSAPVIK